jgi:hypothetical protein
VLALAAPALAQSTNTSTLVVVVVDKTGLAQKGAKISVVDVSTGAARDAVSSDNGSATFSALPITGTYTVKVVKDGFANEERKDVKLRSGETATITVKLSVGAQEAIVVVYGTQLGVRADSQIGRTIDSQEISETPILGRKVSTLPLFNSAFRSGKGIGDLFVNATYFVTAAGSRRTTTTMVDGATDDEGWGRQVPVITMPIGAVAEAAILSNSFNAEYGWTSGPAVNLVTKSGTNAFHGEGLFMARPGKWQERGFSPNEFCPPSITTCKMPTVFNGQPTTLTSIGAVDVPDQLNQVSGTIGGPIVKDRTFFFASADYTRQDRTTALSSALPSFVLDNGSLSYTGEYRQKLVNARVDHKINPNQSLMFRVNYDHFFDTNPQDTVIGTTAPTAARIYTRGGWSTQVNHTAIVSSGLLNEARFVFTNGDPVTEWAAVESGTIYQRTAGSIPFKIGANQVSDLYSRQATFSDTLSWSHANHTFRMGGSLARHMTGGVGNEPGQALLGTFTFLGSGAHATLPIDQLTLADVQNYSQPYSFGAPTAYTLNQWLGVGFIQDTLRARSDLTLDLGLRYDRQSLTQSTKDFAPRIGFGWHPKGNARLAIRGGYGMYYTQVLTNVVAGYIQNGLDGFTTYTATPGQTGFPTCLGINGDTGCSLPLTFSSDPTKAPARNITIVAGKRDYYTTQFPKFGLDFSKVPNYPDQLRNPRSQVMSFGAEREIFRGFTVSADYVHQHWTDLVRTVDLNAPAPFNRTAPGQVRTVAAANATRPITPVTGGVTQINTIMNLGVADYDGLQTLVTYRAIRKLYVAVSYTLSKATNTSEPDGNGIAPNQPDITSLGEQERGPSLLDQRHRAVITVTYQLPYNLTVGTVTQLASARPLNAITGVDNNGDGSATNDRPVINGVVVPKSSFLGTGQQDISIFVEARLKSGRQTVTLRAEGFNLLDHSNLLGRAINTYGDTGTASPSFGQFSGTLQLATQGATSNTTYAIPAFANIDPPRMVQLVLRVTF